MIIEGHYWILGIGFLVLSHWHVGFDQRSEVMDKCNLWVLILGFPISCWNIKGFIGKTNTIKKIMLMEEEQVSSFIHCTPRMFVEMEVLDVFLEDVEVQWEGSTFIQRLDYWHTLFRCHAS